MSSWQKHDEPAETSIHSHTRAKEQRKQEPVCAQSQTIVESEMD